MSNADPIPSDTGTSRISFVVVAAVLVPLAVLGRLGMIAWPFLNDSGLYAAMGKIVANGGVLYRDFYENKLPGAGLITAGFWRLLGTFWPGYVIAQLLLALLAAAMLARITRRHVSKKSTWPTLLYGIVFLNFAWLVFTGFQLEPIQSFFEILGAAAAIEAIVFDQPLDAFAAGLAGGTAAMLKPSGLAFGVAFVVTLLISRSLKRSAIHVSSFAVGVAVPTAVTAMYVIRTGIWPYLPNVLRQIQHYANDTPLDGFMLVKLAIVLSVLALPLLVCRLPVGRSKPSQADSTAYWQLLMFAGLWLVAELIGVLMQRRLYLYHFYPLIGPAALLFGLQARATRPVPVLAGLLPIVLLSLRWPGTDPLHMARGFEHSPVSDYIAAHTVPGDFVYQDQIGRLLIEADRQPGSRFGTFFYFINYDQAPLDYCRGMLADFELRKPKYLAIPADSTVTREQIREPILDIRPVRRANFILAGRRFDRYLAQHYTVETVINGNNIYRRIPDGAVANINEP